MIIADDILRGAEESELYFLEVSQSAQESPDVPGAVHITRVCCCGTARCSGDQALETDTLEPVVAPVLTGSVVFSPLCPNFLIWQVGTMSVLT